MSDGDKFKAIDYLGECVDILYLDPTNLGARDGKKQRRVFQFEEYKSTAGGMQIPRGSQYSPGNIGTEESQTVASTDAGELQEAFTESYAYNAGFGEVFSFSQSKTIKNSRTKMESGEKVLTYTEAKKESGSLELIPTMKAEPLVLDALFSQSVAELPNDVSDSRRAKKYDDFIKAFGTHFMYKVTMGGHAYQWCEISKTTKQNKETTEADWATVAKAAYEGASAGAENTESRNHIKELKATFEFSATGMSWSPATSANADLKTWMASVDADPAICACGLVALNHVLNERFFPKDSHIAEKQKILTDKLKKYVGEKGKDSGLVRSGNAIAIQTTIDGKAKALANVDGTLQLEDASDDPRQHWIVEDPKDESMVTVVDFPRPNSRAPNSGNRGYYLKSAVTGKYLTRSEVRGGPMADLLLADIKGRAVLWGLRPGAQPGNWGQPLPSGAGRQGRPVHEYDRCWLETFGNDTMCLCWHPAWTDKSGKQWPAGFHLLVGPGNPSPDGRVWHIVRKYDALAEFDETFGGWGKA